MNFVLSFLVDNILPASRADENRLLELNAIVSLLGILSLFSNPILILNPLGFIWIWLLGVVTISSIWLRLLT